jgi:endoglucanase
MKSTYRRLSRRETLLALLAGCCAPGGAGAVGTGARVIPPLMARGFNLPDQAPRRLDHVADTQTLSALRKLGMTHVRLPVVAEYVLPQFSGPATVSNAMDDVQRAVDRLLALGFTVTVDMHPGPDFNARHQRDHITAHRALLSGWPLLAGRIRQWPADRVFVELLNEPATTDELWRGFVGTLVQAVRAVLPKTYILVGPAPYHRADALIGWRPLADDRVVYVCHYYDPMMFTHQGSIWDLSAPWGRGFGVPFPTTASDPRLHALAAAADRSNDRGLSAELRNMAGQNWNANVIAAQFAELGRWSAANAAPVIVNEFGVLKWKAARADRLAWLSAVRAAAEGQGFGWAHWDYSTAFGLLDDAGRIDQGVLLALLPENARSVAPSVKATIPITTGKDRGTK